MDFLKHFKATPQNILKVIGIFIGALIILALLVSLFKLSFYGAAGRRSFNTSLSLPSAPAYQSDSAEYYGESSARGAPQKLSLRNVLPVPPGGSTGNTAEEFEVTDYSATIETRRLQETCEIFAELKEKSYVIFESTQQGDRNCAYTFKAEHAHVPEVLSILAELHPKELSENTYTIKRQIDDFASELEILKKKSASIDKTLETALRSYDEITAIATRTQNAEALAKIIDSKINMIERLTRERIAVTNELDRITRAKDEQLDRLIYTYFHVSVYENKFVDGEYLTDSWRAAIKDFVRSINTVLQAVTVGLLSFLLWLLPFGIYLLLALIIIKYGWRLVRHVWQR